MAFPEIAPGPGTVLEVNWESLETKDWILESEALSRELSMIMLEIVGGQGQGQCVPVLDRNKHHVLVTTSTQVTDSHSDIYDEGCQGKTKRCQTWQPESSSRKAHVVRGQKHLV